MAKFLLPSLSYSYFSYFFIIFICCSNFKALLAPSFFGQEWMA